MTASISLGRATSLFLVVLICLAVNNVGAADTEDPCANVDANVDALATDEPALKALYDQARILCAQRKVRTVSDLNKIEKQKAIAEGLAAFATIPAKEGVITKPETADHIGIWQAQRTLFDAAASVGEEVGKAIPEGKKYLVLTDVSALKQRLAVRAAIAQFNTMKNQLEAMNGLLVETLQAFAIAGVPVAAIPSVVTAAQALFSIAKTDLALFALTSPAQKEVMWAGLCSKGCPGMVIPAAATGAVETDLQKSYSVLLKAATKARRTYGDAQGQIEAAGGDQKVPANVRLLRDGLAAQLAEYDALVRSLQTVQTDKTTTLYEDLTQLALETLGPSDISGTLLVTPSAFGGHGGVKSSMWRNDRVLFETTAALSYTLFNADGTVLKSGLVSKGNSSIRDPQKKGLEP